MAFSVFFSLTIILLVSFVAIEKKLHLFEILYMWMVIIFIHHTFLAVTVLNLKLVELPGYGANYWTLVFNRITLIPILIIWFMDKNLSLNFTKRLFFIPFAVCVLVGIEYLAEFLNVFNHSRWKLWWSFIEWGVILLLVYVSWIWYRKILIKEMN